MPRKRSVGARAPREALDNYPRTARALARLGPSFHARGWVLGTSGNFSAVIARSPFSLAITASSIDKSQLKSRHILRVNDRGEPSENGRVHSRTPRPTLTPSAETLLHLEILRRRGAGAVLHTHSVWATLLSDVHAAAGGLELSGYEMLKGLHGVRSHEHREWVPIVANDQDMTRLASVVGNALERAPNAHAFLLQRHGMYTWGASLDDALRHVEILEFLFETIGRTAAFRGERDHGAPQDS